MNFWGRLVGVLHGRRMAARDATQGEGFDWVERMLLRKRVRVEIFLVVVVVEGGRVDKRDESA